MKKIRITEEAHREAKAAAAHASMSLEDWASVMLIAAATVESRKNGREAQEGS